MAATEIRSRTATIARVHGRGFTTREQPNTWLNPSKLASPNLVIPPVGTEVRFKLDGGGYVRDLEPLSAPSRRPDEPAPVQGGTDVAPDANRAPLPHDANDAEPHREAPTAGEPATIRSNLLLCAARLLGPEVSTEDALKLAARLEAWCLRL
jgi:hypothetical protein